MRHRRPWVERPAPKEHDKWIWIANPDPVRNSYMQARRTFALPAKPTRAELKASADSRYKLYVNGHYVGKGPVRAGQGYTCFDTYDVTDLLNKGANAIAFLVHHIGESTYSYMPGKPGLVCKVEVETDAGKQEFGTDEDWRVRRAAEWTDAGARQNEQLGFQEVYDANLEAEAWTEAKFNEKGWEPAAAVGAPPQMPWGELVPRQIPQLREEPVMPTVVAGVYNAPETGRDIAPANVPDLMAAYELSPLKAGVVKHPEALLTDSGYTEVRTPRGDKGVAIVLDFGREVFGNVELGVANSAAGCIDLGYGESLSDGHVKPNAGETRYTDRVLLKKKRLCWQSFEPRAFRYLQVEFRRCSKPVSIEYIRVNETTFPVEQTGDFECSERLLNDIWAAGALTSRLCMEDALIDTPWRERGQWWGDARVLSRAAYYAFDETKLLAQGLRQVAASQGNDGSVLALYPAGEEMLVPDFALLWVFSILDYYAFSDDADLVQELYPAVEALLKWFAQFEAESGLLSDVPGTLLIDRAELERKGTVTSLNCLYYQALRVASALAAISGKPEDAERCVETANRLKVAINKFMYMPKRGLYAECMLDGKLVEKFSRQTNTLAVLFEIADQYQKAGIFRVLGNGSLAEVATPYFGSFYLEALYSIDAHDRALDYIRRKWGEMVKAGSTTLWETFDGHGALCHGSAVCPTRDLIAEYVGIKPVPGTHRFSVSPHPADLKWARGSVNTKQGPLTVEWRVLRYRLDIDVWVPEGLKVDVYPPGPPDTVISVDGKHWPARVITLDGGRHYIRVNAPRASRPATYDEAAPSLIPHVEVLERGTRVGTGRRGIRLETRRRTRGQKREPEETATNLLPEEPLEVRMEGVQIEMPEEPAAETQGEQPQEQPRHKRRSRGRGGRGRKAAEEHAAPEPQPEQAAEAAPVEPAPAAVPETAEEATAHKRRRGSRGRGGRGRRAGEERAAEPQPEQVVETAPSEPAPAAVPETAEEALTHRRRRGSRGRGGRGRSTTAAEPSAAEEAPAPEPPVAAQPETGEEQPKKRRRTYRRRTTKPAGEE